MGTKLKQLEPKANYLYLQVIKKGLVTKAHTYGEK